AEKTGPQPPLVFLERSSRLELVSTGCFRSFLERHSLTQRLLGSRGTMIISSAFCIRGFMKLGRERKARSCANARAVFVTRRRLVSRHLHFLRQPSNGTSTSQPRRK